MNFFSNFSLFSLLSCLFLIGCGEKEFRSAKKAEKLGRYPSAIADYEKFIQTYPKNPKSAEALFRIGEIYRNIFKDYARSRASFEKITAQYKETEWSSRAEIASMNSPDYFPLDPDFKRSMGDSESGGQYMRMEEMVVPIKDSPSRLKMERRIYAGTVLVGKKVQFYEKKDRELREYQPGNELYSVILRYPPEKNLKWETLKEGKRNIFTIEEDRLTVETKAGIFMQCLKVRNQSADTRRSWRYDYYAPEVGLILASVATDKGETRISELVSYGYEKKETLPKTEEGQFKAFWKKVMGLFQKRSGE